MKLIFARSRGYVDFLPLLVVLLGVFAIIQTVVAANVGSQVVVGNSAPAVSSVVINAGSAITLTTNTTTSISITATVTDSNGCADITGGTTTVLLYRSGITSSTCNTTPNDQNCYKATAFTATSSCISSTQINTTTTLSLQYFAQATDASSSFSAQNWLATVSVRDTSNATGTADSSGVELNTLTGINVTTSSIDFGTLGAGADTGSTNQVATTTNAGNSSTTLQLSASVTLTSGGNTIATSSQHYSTSTFTYSGTSTALGSSPVTVGGFTLTNPTSSSNVSKATFWGLAVPGGTPTGTYSGTNVFSSLFIP